MSRFTDRADALDNSDDLLRVLARTPCLEPFEGTARYRVCRAIGEGGFGVVYEVEDRQLGRQMALKTLRPDVDALPQQIRKLKTEFRSVADLVHPNLVGLHELSTEGDRWFFTMDMVHGVDFLDYVCGETALAYDRTEASQPDMLRPPRRDSTGILSESRLRAVLRQLVEGVRALHQAGVVHRDLKPSNVLVEREGRVVILDFGLAQHWRAHDGDHSGSGAGTPAYMAPEQAIGAPLTSAVDWYAVGVMLYEALTGVIPFDAQSVTRLLTDKLNRDPEPPSTHADVPTDLEELCMRMLAREPDARPDADDILRTLGVASAPTTSPRSQQLFVGRQPELAQLRESFAATKTGRPTLLQVIGEPGVGKSALLTKFLGELRERGGVTVLRGRCHEREAVPFKAFDGIVDALHGALRPLPRNEASALMPRDIHLLTKLFPVLSELPSVRDVPQRADVPTDLIEVRRRAFLAFKELVGRLADKAPLVMVIDDLQWGDIDSARLLASLVGPLDPPSLMLVLVYRTDEASRSESLQEVLRTLAVACDNSISLEVDPLPGPDAELLARQLIAPADGSDEVVALVAQRAGGHPLFIAELARGVALGDYDHEPSVSLVDVLWRRAMRLPNEARALLETVALAGQPRDRELCFEAAGVSQQGVEALRSLRAEQLVRASDRGLLDVFHDRVRDAVVGRADAGTQRMRHLALARCLERVGKGDYEALARHYDAAEVAVSASRYAELAGDAATDVMAFERAAKMYELAVRRHAAPGAELVVKKATAYLYAGANVAAGEAFLAAAAKTSGLEATDLRRRAAEQMLMIGDVDRGYVALNQALSDVGQSLPATLGRARLECILRVASIRLRALFGMSPAEATPEERLRLDVLDTSARALEFNDMGRGNAMGARYCDLAMRYGDERQRAFALIGSVFGQLIGQRDRPDAVDDVLNRAEAVAREIGDLSIAARSQMMRGKTYLAFGAWKEAAATFERAARSMEGDCRGMANDRRVSLGLAATAYVRLGLLGRAREIAEVLVIDAAERRDPVIEMATHGGMLAPLALAAGDPDRAELLLAHSQGEDRCTMVLVKTEVRASVHLYRGQAERAVSAWRERWHLIEAHGVLDIPMFRVCAARSMAVSLLASTSAKSAAREAKRIRRTISGYRFDFAIGACEVIAACLALSAARPNEASAHLEAAAEAYQRSATAPEAAACQFRLAEIEGRSTESAAAALSAIGIANVERWVASVIPPLDLFMSRRLKGRALALGPTAAP